MRLKRGDDGIGCRDMCGEWRLPREAVQQWNAGVLARGRRRGASFPSKDACPSASGFDNAECAKGNAARAVRPACILTILLFQMMWLRRERWRSPLLWRESC